MCYCPKCNRDVRVIVTKVINTDEINVRCFECHEIISSRIEVTA